MEIAGNEAVVTGASRGIGRAIAIALGAAGAHVICTARSTRQHAATRLPGTIDETVEVIRAAAGSAEAWPADLTDRESLEELASELERRAVGILVNNAGASTWGSVIETSVRRWDIVLDVNLRSAVRLTKAVLPGMCERRAGAIVNISSASARVVGAGRLSYTVSKGALDAFTVGVAEEVRASAVAVNAIDVERYFDSGGGRSVFPQIEDWRDPAELAATVCRVVGQPPGFTGHVLTLEELEPLLA